MNSTNTELTRRERKKGETRRRIFEAAVDLFRTRGFEATTVDDITEKADVGRGTFFNYFPRKEAVLAYLSDERLEAAEEQASELLTDPRAAREKLVALYRHAASAYTEDRELSRYVFAEWLKRGFAPTREAGTRWEQLVLGLVEQGRVSGELRNDITAARAEAILSGVYIATLYHWLYCPEACGEGADFDLGDELAARLGVLLDGLVAPRRERA